MGTKTAAQIMGTAAIIAILAWECAATGGVAGAQGRGSASESVLTRPDAAPRPHTAIVGARF